MQKTSALGIPIDGAQEPANFPYALFIPEFGSIGSWQQVATPSSPTVPENWATVTGHPDYDGAYHTAVAFPYNLKPWSYFAAIDFGYYGKGNSFFAPGDNQDLLVGVVGTISSGGMWFGSGNTTLYQLESPAKVVSTLRFLRVTLARRTVEGANGSFPREPVNADPTVELAVPLEAAPGVDGVFNLEGGRLTLSADNVLSNLEIRTIHGRTGTIVLNTSTPFGTGSVRIYSGINFEVKDALAPVPTRIINNNIFASERFVPEEGIAVPPVPDVSVININGAGNLTFNGNLTTAYNSPDTGLGLGLAVSGSGTVTLNGANNFGVGVTLNSGTIAIGNDSALDGEGSFEVKGGTIQAIGTPRTVSPPAVKISGDFTAAGLQSLTINGSVDLNGETRTITVSAPVLMLAGGMTNGGLTKTGPGTLVLSGISTHAGGTTVTAGVLQLSNGGTAGAVRGTVGVTNNGTLRLASANSLGTEEGSKVDTINVLGGTLDNTADGDNGWRVSINLNGATMRSNNGINSQGTAQLYSMGGGSTLATLANATSSVIAGRLDLRAGNPNDRLTFSVANGSAPNDLILRAAITETGGSYGLTKNGAGTLLLVGGPDDAVGSGSSYTGGTVINAGVLAVDGNQSQNRLPANNLVTVNSGGTFEIRGVNVLPILSDAIDVTVNSGGTFRVVSGGSAFIGASPNSHAHLRNITLNGGTIDLTYSGTLAAFDGESFEMNGTLAVGGSAPSVIQSSAAANVQGLALAGLRTFAVNDSTASAAVDLTVNAELESTGLTPEDDGLRKTGAGTLLLNRANSYLGSTLVEEGTLLVAGSLAGASTVTGGILGGTGTVKTVHIDALGTLAPGSGIGTLSTQSVTFSGGTLALEVNTANVTHDLLAITGNLTLGTTPVGLSLADIGGNVVLSYGTIQPLLTYTGSWDGHVFAWQGSPLLDGAALTLGANQFRIDYGDNANKTFSLVAVPEPSTATILVGAVLAAACSRRRSLPSMRC